MANKFDVVARLQLKAEQFDSELGKSMANADKLTRSAATQVRSTWATTFAETQKLAGTAITMPRTKTGSLNLSAEIASLKEAAAESDRHAQALREMSIAQTAAAASGKVDAAALKAEADASAVGALAHEREAAGIRERVEALRIVQGELNKTTSQIEIHDAAGKRLTISAGQQRQAMQQLGYQVNDVATQYASGTPVLQIFAQQSGQVIQVVQSMTTKTTGLIGLLGGPWGAVIGAATIVLVPFIGKLIEGNNALADAVDKLKEEAAQSEVTRQARELFGRSEEGVTAAVRESYDASQKLVGVQRTSTEQTLVDARANLATALSIRQKTDAELAWAQALLESAKVRSTQGGERSDLAAMAVQRYETQLADVQKRRLENSIAIGQAEATINNALIAQERAQAKLMQDPVARVTAEWDAKIAALDDQAKREGRITAEYRARSRELERQKTLAVEAEQERQSAANRKPRDVSLGQQVSNEQGSSILSAAQRYTGLRERDAGGNASLRSLFGTAGISIDPEKTAWCAAFVNAVLSGQGVKGTGSLAARSFLGYGTATAKPEKGDVVVLKVEGGQHVGFYAGQKNGRVLVTGGNQSGGQVSTTSFSKSDVQAFRRAPTAAADYKSELKDAAAAARQLKQEQDELERSLDQMLKALDPLAAATARYTDRLADLAKLQASGKITLDRQLDLGRDAQKDFADDKAKITNDDFRRIFGADEVDAISREWEDNVRRATDAWGEGLEDGARGATDLLRDGVGDITSMLGVRLKGSLGGMLSGRGSLGLDAKRSEEWSKKLATVGVKIDPTSMKTLSESFSLGQLGGGTFASITGGKKSALGSSIGGVLGSEAGKALAPAITSAVGGALGQSLGQAAGPIGAIAGGILGNVVGGLFQKTKQASSTITFGSDGLAASAAKGTGTAEKAAASASANSVVGSLNRIAEALGGEVTGAGSVSIGYRPGHKDGAYRVDTTGKGRLTGVLAFATEEEAIRAAIADALKDGVVGGISDASKRILAAGGDLEKAITKASLIEAVPKDLKAMLDPLGAAIDELNRKFQKTVDALKEGGATAEQMADAQKLYDLQLAQVKASTAAASASLKEFLKDLVNGSDSPLSLRDREAAALADLKPFLTQIDAGQSIDQSKYQEAAKLYLDIERELYGSTAKFFEAFDAVQASTNKAIATIDNAVPVTAGVASPFAKETADSAAATAAGVQTGNEISAEHTDLLLRIAQAVESLGGDVGDASAFIGAGRGFASLQVAR